IFIGIMQFFHTFLLCIFAIFCRMDAEVPYYCVTKADPYTLTRCPRNYSLCYTLENNSNHAVIYGCANDETSLPSNKFWSYSRCSDNLHDFCPEEQPFSVTDPYPRLCCCDSSQCNDRSSNSEVNNGTQNAVQSVFKRSLLNRRGVTTVKESTLSWRSIIGIASGALGVLCIAAFATFAFKRRLNVKRKSASANNSESAEKSAEDLEGEDANQEGMECGPGKKCVNVLHIDRTKTIVPSRLPLPEHAALLRSLKKNKKVKTVYKGKRAPTITEVITFATTDEITLIENGDATKDANGMFNEENSGRLLLSNEANEKIFRVSGTSRALKLLAKMIAHGPRQYSFHLDELTDVLKKGTEVFLHEPSLLEVPVPCVVYGDIHGQYSDLHRWFNLNGWPWKVRSVFLGDFVDRGTHGIEVITLLTALKASI
uniref:protein-serine/threonine phosphatase n=1 Tax=Parascaris univalens TaxID=6257 RepID=A0A915A267_PARUN